LQLRRHDEGRFEALAATPVNEVWGVGRRISAQLNEGGYPDSAGPGPLDTATIRKWSVVLERTVRELQGTPALN
jgi:DNA polymerase V